MSELGEAFDGIGCLGTLPCAGTDLGLPCQAPPARQPSKTLRPRHSTTPGQYSAASAEELETMENIRVRKAQLGHDRIYRRRHFCGIRVTPIDNLYRQRVGRKEKHHLVPLFLWIPFQR